MALERGVPPQRVSRHSAVSAVLLSGYLPCCTSQHAPALARLAGGMQGSAVQQQNGGLLVELHSCLLSHAKTQQLLAPLDSHST